MTIQRYNNLNPEKALIWRIVHRDNAAWILDHGLHCSNAKDRHAPGWVSIGQAELIEKILQQVQRRRLSLKVVVKPGWYFQ